MRGAPQRGFASEVNDLSRQGRAALWMATLPAPIEAESSSMPGDHRFRFDDQQSGSATHARVARARPTGICRRQSDAPCVHGMNAEGPRADAEGQGSRLESQREFEILAELKRAARE